MLRLIISDKPAERFEKQDRLRQPKEYSMWFVCCRQVIGCSPAARMVPGRIRTPIDRQAAEMSAALHGAVNEQGFQVSALTSIFSATSCGNGRGHRGMDRRHENQLCEVLLQLSGSAAKMSTRAARLYIHTI